MRSSFRTAAMTAAAAALVGSLGATLAPAPAWAVRSCFPVSYKGSAFDSVREARHKARYSAGAKARMEANERMKARLAGLKGWSCRVTDVGSVGETCREVLAPQVGPVRRKFYACTAIVRACFQCFPPPRIWLPNPVKK